VVIESGGKPAADLSHSQPHFDRRPASSVIGRASVETARVLSLDVPEPRVGRRKPPRCTNAGGCLCAEGEFGPRDRRTPRVRFGLSRIKAARRRVVVERERPNKKNCARLQTPFMSGIRNY